VKMWDDQIIPYDTVFGRLKRDLGKSLYDGDPLDHVYLSYEHVLAQLASTTESTSSCGTLGNHKPPTTFPSNNAFRSGKPMG
jgi:hypothetical protein